MIVVDGEVVSPTAYRPSAFVDLEDTVAWWSALAVLGAFLFALGALVGRGLGETVAVSGVLLFFATAVLAGAERTEFATAVGAAAVVWTATGIAVVLGSDPSLFVSLLGFTIGGASFLALGSLGAARARARSLETPPPRRTR